MYRNPWGFLRIGRVLEDIDSLAGNIAFAHSDDGDPATAPPMLVTAAVERIELRAPVTVDADVALEGQVVYTGTTSMDIRICLKQDGRAEPNLVALVTFVARHPGSGAATPVNQVEPRSAEERAWFDERAAVAAARKAARKAGGAGADLGASGAGAQRAVWAGRLLQEAQTMQVMPGLAASDALLMSATALSNTFTCQPQQRNIHGRIFGGFLMRRAYELAFATVYMFAGCRPRFLSVDRVDFKRPVDVGDLVGFRGTVTHTRNLLDHPGGPRGQLFVEVDASIHRPEAASSTASNTFAFLFEVDIGVPASSSSTRHPLKRVLPGTAAEARIVERYYPAQYETVKSPM